MRPEPLHTVPVSSKGQITLPVNIRQMLGITGTHRIIGICRRGRAIEIAKVRVLKEPIRFASRKRNKLDKISGRKGKRRFRSTRKLIKHRKTGRVRS